VEAVSFFGGLAAFGLDAIYLTIGLFFLLDGVSWIPIGRAFFAPAGGAVASFRASRLLWGGWMLFSAMLLFPNPWTRWIASIVLWTFTRHYFIRLRWATPRRGGGAPGFMNDFTARLLVFFSSAIIFDRSGSLGQAVLWIGRLDLVAIVGCAGLYKLLSGYARGEGMEFGMVNPMWGYAWKFWGTLAPSSLVFRFWNHAGWWSELLAAVLLLTPMWWLGGFLVSAGFLVVAGMIRLGRLAFLMAFLPIVFFPPLAEDLLAQAQRHGIMALPAGSWEWVVAGWALLLFLTKVVQYFNLLKKKKVWSPLQKIADGFGQIWPVILWRVFTADITNFFVRIRRPGDPEGVWLVHEESTYRYGRKTWKNPRNKLRFLHVTESIALASVFTQLKYYPSDPERFHERILAYAASLPDSRPSHGIWEFHLMQIEKRAEGFHFQPTRIYRVEVASQRVEETWRRPDDRFAEAHEGSSMTHSAEPGVYWSEKLCAE
jgi:hypothetical protein